MKHRHDKPIHFTCPNPDCGRPNETNNKNRKQRCLFCGEGVELDIRRNGHGKNGSIQVLNVRARALSA